MPLFNGNPIWIQSEKRALILNDEGDFEYISPLVEITESKPCSLTLDAQVCTNYEFSFLGHKYPLGVEFRINRFPTKDNWSYMFTYNIQLLPVGTFHESIRTSTNVTPLPVQFKEYLELIGSMDYYVDMYKAWVKRYESTFLELYRIHQNFLNEFTIKSTQLKQAVALEINTEIQRIRDIMAQNPAYKKLTIAQWEAVNHLIDSYLRNEGKISVGYLRTPTKDALIRMGILVYNRTERYYPTYGLGLIGNFIDDSKMHKLEEETSALREKLWNSHFGTLLS